MLNSIGRNYTDFSGDLRDLQDWNIANLTRLDFCLDGAVLAFDAVSRLVAVGTLSGVVHIIGAPGVHTEISLSTTTPIKFLEFATSIHKLICIDENDRLYIWDLTSVGKFRLEATTRIEQPVTYLSLTPCHTHAFISLESGDIKAYDLLCRRFSKYIVPNAWDIYAKSLQADGMVVDMDGESRIPIQVVTHPRNPGVIFIAYGGGVALLDLGEHSTLRVYELLIPAGAPGGAGYTDPDLLKHRRPPVTTVAIHPSGHFFAVGHADGSLAFWAVDDDEQPLVVRTLDDVGVNLVDGNKLDEFLPGSDRPPATHDPREPIFKLAWSGYPNSKDPRGGETSLLILGGQFSRDPGGVNVLWLPAFNPVEPPAASTPQPGLHPYFREAMRKSLDPLDAYFYQTCGLTHDFLLVPRDSPHFAGTWEPVAVLFISEDSTNIRAIEAFQFPPQLFLPPSPPQKQLPETSSPDIADDLANALRDLQVSVTPEKLGVPPSLWNGPMSIVASQLHVVDRLAYETISLRVNDPPQLELDGGVSVADEHALSEIKAAKFEPHRIVVTQHDDQSLHFLDISPQLLIPSAETALVSPFPQNLPSLAIEPLAVLHHPSIRSRTTVDHLRPPSVQSVHFMSEALEVFFVFSTGAVVMYRLRDVPVTESEKELEDEKLISLEHIPVGVGLRFKPCLLILSATSVSAFSATDIGFAAVGYADGSLNIVDLRGPRSAFHTSTDKDLRKHSLGNLLHKSQNQAIEVFVWTICALSADPIPRVRLVAIRTSGSTTVYTLFRARSGDWTVQSEPTHSEMIAPLSSAPGGAFVLDGRLGVHLKASKHRLSVALDKEQARSLSPPSRGDSGSDSELRCVLVVVGTKGARCYSDLSGDKRIGRTDWGTKTGIAVNAQVIERNASSVLAVITDKSQALIYALPALDHLHTFPLPTPSSHLPSIDTTGDILTLTGAPANAAILDTFFNSRRGYHTPQISLTERRDAIIPRVPAQPVPVSIGPVGWLTSAGSLFGQLTGVGTSTLTGAQVDTLLAGPDRPVPQKSVPRVEREKYKEWTDSPAKVTATTASQTQSSLYNRLHTALAERGEALGELEQNFNALGEGSRSMVDQAKRLATQQSAKSWFTWKTSM